MTMKNGVFWDITPSGSCQYFFTPVNANVVLRSPIFVTLIMEAIRSS
jgi:hypothetical protein